MVGSSDFDGETGYGQGRNLAEQLGDGERGKTLLDLIGVGEEEQQVAVWC